MCSQFSARKIGSVWLPRNFVLRCKPLERLIFGKSLECQLWLWIVSFRDKHACHRWCAKLTFRLPNQQMCSTFLVDGGLLLKRFSVMFLASSLSWGLQVGEDGNDKLRCVFDLNNSTNRALCWPKDPWQDSLQRLKKSLPRSVLLRHTRQIASCSLGALFQLMKTLFSKWDAEKGLRAIISSTVYVIVYFVDCNDLILFLWRIKRNFCRNRFLNPLPIFTMTAEALRRFGEIRNGYNPAMAITLQWLLPWGRKGDPPATLGIRIFRQ